jgi:hypothetical protein
MTYTQTMGQPDTTEEDVRAWLTAKPLQELRHFMATAWVASLLSAEVIEELYQELQREEASEDLVAVGQD